MPPATPGGLDPTFKRGLDPEERGTQACIHAHAHAHTCAHTEVPRLR